MNGSLKNEFILSRSTYIRVVIYIVYIYTHTEIYNNPKPQSIPLYQPEMDLSMLPHTVYYMGLGIYYSS